MIQFISFLVCIPYKMIKEDIKVYNFGIPLGFCICVRSSFLKMLFSLILFWLNFFILQDYNVMFAEVFITYSLKKRFT